MNTEIEARFLNIDKQALIARLIDAGAVDRGERMLSEVILYDADNKWPEEGRFVRIRTSANGTVVTYKHNPGQSIDSAKEIEFNASDPDKVEKFLEVLGLLGYRHQEKLRHSFELGDIKIDIDTWPKVPTYVEIEGKSEKGIKLLAEQLGFSWKDAVFEDARQILQEHYGIPIGSLKWFTFSKIE